MKQEGASIKDQADAARRGANFAEAGALYRRAIEAYGSAPELFGLSAAEINVMAESAERCEYLASISTNN